MKINLDTKVVQLDGTPFTRPDKSEVTIGSVLSDVLDNAKEGGRMKLFVLAKKCYEGGSQDFDDADIHLMKKVVESSTLASNVVVGQIVSFLEDAKSK